jgi:hypothetical protein
MEFMNRSAQPTTPARAAGNGGTAAPTNSSKPGKSPGWKSSPQWLRVVWVVLLFSVTVLVVALVALLYFGGSKEQDYVDSNKKQAVFLTNGQVYFGEIKSINKQYVDLQGIYYLNVNQQVQPDQKTSATQQNTNQNSSISLVKLGCELHGPVDRMLINREQVTFWENLKDDGQVAKAIAQWVQQNPNGQTCSTANNATDTDAKP